MRVLNKMMIIDDDPITSVVLEKVNTTLGFAQEVVSFYSAVDGLDYLLSLREKNQRLPEVIFLDISMPIVSGWQFLEHYESLSFSGTTIYMLTASNDQSDINRAKKFANVEDYLVKPLTISQMKAIRAAFTEVSAPVATSAS